VCNSLIYLLLPQSLRPSTMLSCFRWIKGAVAGDPEKSEDSASKTLENKLNGLNGTTTDSEVSVEYPFDNIVDALRHAASHTTEGIVAYKSNNSSEELEPERLSYGDLLQQATENANRLRQRALWE